MNINDNTLKAINVIKFNGNSINLNDLCMSHTNFKHGQILEAAIYGNMIVITPAEVK
jgi:hypothetical protein